LVAGRRRCESATTPTLLLTTALYMLDRTALCSLARTSIVAAQSLTYSPYHCRGHSSSVRWSSTWLSWHGRIHPTADRPLHRASVLAVPQEGRTTIAAATSSRRRCNRLSSAPGPAAGKRILHRAKSPPTSEIGEYFAWLRRRRHGEAWLATHGAYTPLHARHPHRVAGMPALPAGAGLPRRAVYALARHLASYRRTTDLQPVLCKSGIGTQWHISKRRPHLLPDPTRHKLACMHQHRSVRAVWR